MRASPGTSCRGCFTCSIDIITSRRMRLRLQLSLAGGRDWAACLHSSLASPGPSDPSRTLESWVPADLGPRCGSAPRAPMEKNPVPAEEGGRACVGSPGPLTSPPGVGFLICTPGTVTLPGFTPLNPLLKDLLSFCLPCLSQFISFLIYFIFIKKKSSHTFNTLLGILR